MIITSNQTSGFQVPWSNGSKVGNIKKKLTKDHFFVKIMTSESLKLYAHLRVIAKHSAQYQVSPIMNVEGVAGSVYVSLNSIKNSQIKIPKSIFTSSYHRMEVYKISNEYDESCRERVMETRFLTYKVYVSMGNNSIKIVQ